MIWVVTDDQFVGDGLLQLIRSKGYTVDQLDCGEAVSKRIRFRLPVMLIIDCRMAEGFELVASVRGNPRAGGLPIVMFAVGDDAMRDRALAQGADAFVSKGALDWVELLQEIQRFVGRPADANPT